VAGNTVTKTVSGIQIDRTKPTTTGAVAGSASNGWYRDAVQGDPDGSDNLSNVAATYYKVDGAATQTYNGAFSFGTEGSTASPSGAWTEPGTSRWPVRPDRPDRPDRSRHSGDQPRSRRTAAGSSPPASRSPSRPPMRAGVAATYYQSIDGGTGRPTGSRSPELSEGTHTITYWSVDLAGNVEMKDSDLQDGQR
jgi:hypothetical protein